MKKNLFLGGILAFCAAAVLTGCTTGTEETLQYVNLSQVSCSFLGEGNQPLVIEREGLARPRGKPLPAQRG